MKFLAFVIFAIWFSVSFSGCMVHPATTAPVVVLEAEPENKCMDQFMTWCKKCSEGGIFCEE